MRDWIREKKKFFDLINQCYVIDDGGPIGDDLQELLSNHPELLQLNVVVVSMQGKGIRRKMSGTC